MRLPIGPLRRIAAYARVFQTPQDMYTYSQLRRDFARNGRSATPRSMRLRSLGGAAVLCRQSDDVWTLKHTFMSEFHLPPMQLPERAVILDLGSNVGYTTAHFAYRYPSARVIGVEMDAHNMDLARHNTAAFGPHVELIHAAIWDRDGVIGYDGDSDDDAFAVSTVPSVREPLTARSVCLQTLIAERSIGRIDYVKMDIEGAEATILAGDMSWSALVRSMKIEVHPPATPDYCSAVLEQYGCRTWTGTHHRDTVCAVRS